jgi:hypothetical protein
MDVAFNPEHPERFLYFQEIPYIKDKDDDYEVRTVDLRYEEEEETSEPWASFLPKHETSKADRMFGLIVL